MASSGDTVSVLSGTYNETAAITFNSFNPLSLVYSSLSLTTLLPQLQTITSTWNSKCDGQLSFLHSPTLRSRFGSSVEVHTSGTWLTVLNTSIIYVSGNLKLVGGAVSKQGDAIQLCEGQR
jgi:hypothetical protein